MCSSIHSWRFAHVREELDGERELIKEIMRYIGVLHDIQPTEKSIAAGGQESVKDPETGVSDPYTTTYNAKSGMLLVLLPMITTMTTPVPTTTVATITPANRILRHKMPSLICF